MPWIQINQTIGYELKMKKTVIKSLPTKSYHCGTDNLETCIKNTLIKTHKKEHFCHVPFLNNDKNIEICPNDVIMDIIKILNYHVTTQKSFKDCQDLKPCQEIVYEIVDKFETHESEIVINFPNQLVEVITDSYSYTGLSLFAELGGVIGMLLGFSVFGLLDESINKIQIFWNFIRRNDVDDLEQTKSKDIIECIPEKNGFEHQLMKVMEEVRRINEEIQFLKDMHTI